MNGKGSSPRPLSVTRKVFEDNWDEIFGNKMNKSRRSIIIAHAKTAGQKFISSDREECEELPLGEIESALEADEINLGEIGEVFIRSIQENCEKKNGIAKED